MARIAFLLLCHKDPAGVIEQAERLTAPGDFVAIHYDGRAPASDYRRVQEALSGNPRVTFTRRRLRCGWGEWSLVAATIEAARAALSAFPLASHLYLMSGDCMPVKSSEYAREFLDAADCDYIETADFLDSGWIKTGIREERLVYRHWFNERRHKGLFYRSMAVQARLGLRRAPPADLRIMIGSQWWCLRRETVERLLAFCEARPAIVRFFRTTWIPDETFFQTLVAHLVPRSAIRSRTLTFLLFTDYGMPVVFCNDHYDLLLGQDFLFARKISPQADLLKQRLGALWGSGQRDFLLADEGQRLHRFLTGRGRVGRRFAPRAWEQGSEIGRGRTIHVIIAKKWHVAKRLTAALRDRAGVAACDYVFDEVEAGLPDLGGGERALGQRRRHRRAFLRLLADRLGARSLVICLDPSARDVLNDLMRDRAELRALLIDCDFDDDWLRGHVRRIGLVGASAADAQAEALAPAIRAELRDEVEQLLDMGLLRLSRIAAGASPAENAAALERFLDLAPATAQAVAATPHLFDD